MASTSEVGRQIPKLGSQVDGDLKDLGQAGTGTPASVPWCFHASGWQPPAKREQAAAKSSHFPFSPPLRLGGLWANSAVSSLGELHVCCTLRTRNACSAHRVPLNYDFSLSSFSLHTIGHSLQLDLL